MPDMNDRQAFTEVGQLAHTIETAMFAATSSLSQAANHIRDVEHYLGCVLDEHLPEDHPARFMVEMSVAVLRETRRQMVGEE